VPGGPVFALIAIALFAFNLRTAISGFTPVLELVRTDIGFSDAGAGIIGAIPTAVFSVTAFASNRVLRGLSQELVLFLGAIVSTAGIVLRSFSDSLPALIVTMIAAVAGLGFGNVVLIPVVKRYFPRRIGVVTGMYTSAMQVGAIISPIVAAGLAAVFSWREGAGVWAIPIALAAVVWGVQWGIVRRRTRAERELAAAEDEAARASFDRHDPATGPITLAALEVDTELPASERHVPFSAMLRSPIGWGVALLLAMNALSSYSLFTWVPRIFVDYGETLGFGANMVALISVWALVGAFVVPVLTVRVRQPYVLVVTIALIYGAGMIGLLAAPLAAPLLWISLIALGLNIFPLVLTIMNLRTRTSAGSAALSGFGQGTAYAIASIGPVGMGLLHTATGSWTAPLLALVGTMAFTLVGGWFVCRPRFLEDEPAVAAALATRG